MLMRQKPSDNHEYYVCNNSESRELQRNNFQPRYFYENEFYYILTKELKNYLELSE